MSIKIQNLSRSFPDITVFENLNLEFKEGTITCIMGKSGVGKTTLLSMMMGLLKPDEGKIEGLSDKKISAVFQENRLCDNLTAVLNIKMVTDLYGRYKEKDILSYLSKIGIDGTIRKPVKEFSGGMQRRVAILRALMAESDILIMDEPLKGLDEETKDEVKGLILDLTKGKTVIMSTHDVRDAESFGAEVVQI